MGKRFFDIFFSAAVLLLGMPVFILIAFAIKISSPGPVFYFSKRVGRDGVIFLRQI